MLNKFQLYDLSTQLLTEFLEEIKSELLDYLQTENRNATGKSAASLTVTADGTHGQLTGHKGIEYVFRGRGPGKLPPLGAIIDWCNARGLPRSAAWAIAKIIAKSGSVLWRQGRNVLNEVITQEKIDKFKNDILITFTLALKTEVDTLIAA
jgi:hypothetical protein